MPERGETILQERIRGDSLRQIAPRHGISYENVRLIERRETERHLADVAESMWLAQREDRLWTFRVSGGSLDDYRRAIRYCDWLLPALDALGVSTRVQPTPAEGVFAVAAFARPDTWAARHKAAVLAAAALREEGADPETVREAISEHMTAEELKSLEARGGDDGNG